MESAIVYGLTATLYGEISIKNGAVQQSNFHDYQMLRINEMPEVEVQIINGDHKRLGGRRGTGTATFGTGRHQCDFCRHRHTDPRIAAVQT